MLAQNMQLALQPLAVPCHSHTPNTQCDISKRSTLNIPTILRVSDFPWRIYTHIMCSNITSR